MILLSGQSLTAARVVPAVSMSVQLKERESTATLTPADMEGISVGSWLKDDREPGAGIVWRVRSIAQAFHTNTPTVQLEHAISVLKDKILFGEVKPSTITGNAGATTCTARQAIEYILGQQSDWTLGTFGYGDVSNPYKFDGDSLFEALETVTNSLEDAWWTYDMSVYPFLLNITQHSADVDSEMRAGRNMRTISRTIDKSGMFTRFYPIGKDDLHIDSSYVEKNTDLYGVISKVETDQSLDTKAELSAWANEQLNKHAQPNVTIAVEGLELSRETGETLDQLTIGRVCRCPLPEYETTIQERINQIDYADKISRPDDVKVTMANSRNDVTKIIADALRRSGRSGRTSSRQQKEDHAWFEDTNEHVSMTAIGIIGVDAQGNPNWTRMSEFIADGEGLHAKVETQIGAATDRIATLEISESEIRTDVAAANSAIYSYIQQTASSINIRVAEKKRTWIQDTDPRNGGITPSEGDIWVESTHQGTWDGAEGFDWEHDEDYDWSQVQGAKIWGWANDKWELVSDQQQVVTITDVETTSEHFVARALKALTNDEGNLSVYRAELLVEGDRIRSEVHAATSEMYSFILQTASQITIRVGESNMVFSGTTQPTGTADHPLVDGDLWLETNFQRIWADQEELDSWIDDEDFDWSDMKGSKVHVYDATLGAFREVLDEQVLAQDTDIDETSEKISLVARSLKAVDGKVDVYRAEFKVTSDQIKSSVNQRLADVGSTITQTAREIRAEVHAAQSTIYSSISQTASQIRAEVADTANGLNSVITQTANQIRTEVNAANSTIYSSITQTASQIRSEVASSVSSLNSSITQTASAIRTEVNSAKSSIYSSITQTASAIRSEVANSVSGLRSSIQQTANTISAVVTGSGANAQIKPAAIQASINQATGTSKIVLSADHIILDGDAVASSLEGKSIAADYLGADTFQIIGNMYVDGAATIEYEYGSSYDMENLIVGASVSGNTLTLTKLNGNTVNFDRATSLSGNWSGDELTITANDSRITPYKVAFTGSPTVKLGITTNGTATKHATLTAIVVPMKVCSIVGDNWTSRYTENITVPATNLEAGNIKKNVSIFGVTGTYEGQSRTDKGSSWYCTITQDSSGKHCRLSKDFGLSQNVPFSNGSSYHLYT